MKRIRSRVVILLFVVCGLAGGQAPAEYWVDPDTGLMWAGRDNGKDVSWRAAMNYCRDLRLAGYSDWRLATIDELQGIFDGSATSPGINPKSHWHPAEAWNYRVKGKLFLSGDPWSSSQRSDDRGKPSGYVWFFDYVNGRPDNDPTGWPYGFVGRRALCVRRPPMEGGAPAPGV
jgi:hypothetical protein